MARGSEGKDIRRAASRTLNNVRASRPSAFSSPRAPTHTHTHTHIPWSFVCPMQQHFLVVYLSLTRCVYIYLYIPIILPLSPSFSPTVGRGAPNEASSFRMAGRPPIIVIPAPEPFAERARSYIASAAKSFTHGGYGDGVRTRRWCGEGRDREKLAWTFGAFGELRLLFCFRDRGTLF